VSVFCAGLVLGALTTAILVWLMSGLSEPVPAAIGTGVLGVLAVVAVMRDTSLLRFRRPECNRQVPRELLTTKGAVAVPLQFGFEMGTGLRTHLTATAPHLLACTILLIRPSLAIAMLAGASFGIGRMLHPLLRLWSRTGGGAWDTSLSVWNDRIVATSTVLCAVAVVAVASGTSA
jgi:hypothetical protein